MSWRTKPIDLPLSVVPEHPEYSLERYSVREAAAYLRRSTDIVYREAAAGRLGHRRDSARRLVFSQADLDLWRQAHRREARDAQSEAVRESRRVVRAEQRVAVLPMPSRRRFA